MDTRENVRCGQRIRVSKGEFERKKRRVLIKVLVSFAHFPISSALS
jgi:hypothetical protein